MARKRANRNSRRGSTSPGNIHHPSEAPQDEHRLGECATTMTTSASAVDTVEVKLSVVEKARLLPKLKLGKHANDDGDATALEEGRDCVEEKTKQQALVSPRLDAQLGGYPPDCGTKDFKYLSYAKVQRDRGTTHPMRYSATNVDALGFSIPEPYPVFSTDFGGHAFHRLLTESAVLSQYGLGVTLYFKYLKVMSWLFLLLVALSAPALVVYIVGGGTSLDEFKALARQDLPSVLGLTSIGHLSEIGFVKAVYSNHDAQGSCSCPERNKVAEGSGLCRGQPEESMPTVCPADGNGCFLGVHPVSLWPCCSFSLDSETQTPRFDEMRIKEPAGCASQTAQKIVEGLCLGKKSCSLNVSETLVYAWEGSELHGTTCANTTNESIGEETVELCEAALNDDSDYSQCISDDKRALIVYARCFATSIDLADDWSFKIIGWDSISRSGFLGLAVGCDVACSLIFFLAVLWLRRKEEEDVARIAQDQIKALDYTVQLMHLPRHKDVNLLREEIRVHLETVLSAAPSFTTDLDRIRIADIQFGKSASGHLRLLRRRGVVVRRLEVVLQRHEKLKLLVGRLSQRTYAHREKRHLRLAHKLETKLRRHDAKLEHWHARQKRRNASQAVTAFVTFEEEEGFHRCLQEYPDLGWLHRLFQPRAKRLHGKRLHFRPAPDPTDIIWENLHYPLFERLLRQVIVTLVTLAVLLTSFVLIFAAKVQKGRLERQFGRPTSCPADVSKEDVMQDELDKISGLVPYKALVECFCKNFLVTHSFRSMVDESFMNPETGQEEPLCRMWATNFVTTQALSVASVLVVVAVNVLLARVLNVLVGMEKHHTQSNLVVSRITKVFLSQLCNTALLMVVINANVGYFSDSPVANQAEASGGGLAVGWLQLMDGEYADFSAAWYRDVGVALMLTMIVNAFSLHATVLSSYVTLKVRRFFDRGLSFDHSRTRQDTQRDLETLYRGPKFDLAARYAQTLTSIFITYLFSAGMPLLHLVGFTAMVTTYWADKFTFLRIARSPPLYDSKVATAAGSLLPYAVVLHCLAAMWMFSNERIFQSASDITLEFAAADNSSSNLVTPGDGIPAFDTVHRGQVFSRVTRPQVVVLFAFFVGCCVLVFLRTVLFEYAPAAVRSIFPVLTRLLEKPRVAKGVPNYFDAIPTECIQEKLAAAGGVQQLVRPELRAKYEKALARRVARDEKLPQQRSTRSLSAAERYSQANWIVGCPSYAISDNKEYVAELAIDSHLSEEISLDQLF